MIRFTRRKETTIQLRVRVNSIFDVCKVAQQPHHLPGFQCVPRVGAPCRVSPSLVGAGMGIVAGCSGRLAGAAHPRRHVSARASASAAAPRLCRSPRHHTRRRRPNGASPLRFEHASSSFLHAGSSGGPRWGNASDGWRRRFEGAATRDISRRRIAALPPRIDDGELLVGDVVVLWLFALVQKIASVTVSSSFPGWLAPVVVDATSVASFISESAWIVSTWVAVSTVLGAYELKDTGALGKEEGEMREAVKGGAKANRRVGHPPFERGRVLTTLRFINARCGYLARQPTPDIAPRRRMLRNHARSRRPPIAAERPSRWELRQRGAYGACPPLEGCSTCPTSQVGVPPRPPTHLSILSLGGRT